MEHWLAARDEPDEWTFEWKLLGVDGGRAFVQGLTSYCRNRPNYDNLWVVQLAGDGRASAFTEWFMPRSLAFSRRDCRRHRQQRESVAPQEHGPQQPA